MNLALVFPQKEHEKLWHDIIDEFQDSGEKIIPYALKLKCDCYNDFLAETNNFRSGESISPESVPAVTYFLMDKTQNKILGAINIRYRLNDYLEKYGGHIGYGIAPSERGKGYATKMLSLALEKCRELNIERVLLTCDEDNFKSSKTIINNGGVLENELCTDYGTVVRRYWIQL